MPTSCESAPTAMPSGVHASGYESGSDAAPFVGMQVVDDGESAAVCAEDEDLCLGLRFYGAIVAGAARYSCRLRGGPALLVSASASARAVSRLVKHAMLASTAARRIL